MSTKHQQSDESGKERDYDTGPEGEMVYNTTQQRATLVVVEIDV